MIRKLAFYVLAALFLYFATTGLVFGASAAVGQGSAASSATVANSRVPLYFEENQGQTAGEVRFLARAGGYTAFLTGHETVLHYHNGMPGQKDGRDAVVRMRLAGSRKSSIIRGGEQLPGIVNYLIGDDPSKWHTRIPTYAEVDFDKVYPGVDLVYRAAGKQLEFDFRVAAGANPDPIRMTYSGASKMHLNASGDLVLDTDAGPASILKPVAYQDVDNKRVPISVNYALLANGEVGFQLGKYDRTRPLVIDPTVGPSVYYSTYLGSGQGDTFTSIAVDPAGEAFITGYTYATNYPIGAPSGYLPYQGTFPSNYYNGAFYPPAGFVTALNATGTGIIYSTFVSGDSANSSMGVSLNGIAVDADGFAFVGGQTDDPTFPMVKAFQSTIPGARSVYFGYTVELGVVFELSQHGDSLVYSSFLGGGDTDSITAIAVDSSDNAYVSGANTVAANYTTSGFPTTSGVIWPAGFDQEYSSVGAGFTNAFAAKIVPPASGTATKAYATLIGCNGSGDSSTPDTATTSATVYGNAIAIDSSGNAYIAGTANCDVGWHSSTSFVSSSIRKNMTNVTPALSGEQSLVSNTWVLKLNAGATSVFYLDYLGGSAPSNYGSCQYSGTNYYSPTTSVTGIKVDSNGVAYVAGTTQANDFQTTSGALYTSRQLAGISGSGYSGGGCTYTYSGTIQTDGYVTLIAADGLSFPYSTFLNGSTVSAGVTAAGSSGSLTIAGIALGTGGQFAVAGMANTSNFPVQGSPSGTPLLSGYPGCGAGGANSSTCADGAAFITKFNSTGALVYSTFVGAGGEYGVNGIASNGTDIYVMISEPNNGLTTSGAYDTDNSSAEKELVVRVLDKLAISTTVTVDNKTADFSSSSQVISLTSDIGASSTVNGGTVTYYLTNSTSGQVGPPFSVTSGIVSNGLPPATLFTLPASTPAGTYTIHADYVGAAGFLGSSGTGSLVVSSIVNTSTTVTSSTNPSIFGQVVTFTATVTAVAPGTGTPTGSVQFVVDGVNFGSPIALTGASSNSSTATSQPTATLSVAGSPHSVTANYVNADGNFSNSSGALSGGQTVTKAGATTAVTSSLNPSTFGQSVTFTATVTAVAPGTGTPTGSVQFVVDGVNFGSPIALTGASSNSSTATSQAMATLSVAGSPHTVTANYVNADGNFNNSTSAALTQNVNPATTTTTAVVNDMNTGRRWSGTEVTGASAFATSTVQSSVSGGPTPTGTVTYSLYTSGNCIGQVVQSQTVTLSSGVVPPSSPTAALAAGSYSYQASYSGDSNYLSSTSCTSLNVNKTVGVPVVSSGTNPSVFGQYVTFAATINSMPGFTPTGTVTFKDGTTTLGTGTPAGPGVWTYATSTLTASGSPHSITAVYGGDANYSGGTGSLAGNQIVNQAAPTNWPANVSISPASSSILGQPVTITVPVATGATGQVLFYDNSVVIGSAQVNSGNATFTTAVLQTGGHSITASYLGDANYLPSGPTSPSSYTVSTRATSSAIHFSPTSVGVGVGTTATVSVTDTVPSNGAVGAGAPGSSVLAAQGLPAPGNGRSGQTATLQQDGTVLIVGGTGTGGVLSTAVIYSYTNSSSDPTLNPTQGVFTAIASPTLNTARTGHTATLLRDGTVLVVGGNDGTNALGSAEIINPNVTPVTVTALTNGLNAARTGHTATLLSNGQVLILGGQAGGSPVTSPEVYTPGTQSFANVAAGSLAVNRFGHTATLLADGQTILVAGGDVGSSATAELISYSSSGGTITNVGSPANLPAAISGHTATLLADGTVVITGGSTGGTSTPTVVLFQTPAAPLGTTFAQTNFVSLNASALQTARSSHTATLLDDGLVLVAGGIDAGGNTLSSAEVYTPSYDPQGTAGSGASPITSGDSGTADTVTPTSCALAPTGNGAPSCQVTITAGAVSTGTHTANVSYAGDNNHSGTTATGSYTVVQGAPVVTVADAGGTYNGSPFPATGSATGLGGVTLSPAVTLSYSGTGSTSYEPTSTAPTNAGTYQVIASFAGNADYLAGSSTSVAFTISKATPAFSALSSATITYGQGPTTLSGTILAPGSLAPTGGPYNFVAVYINGQNVGNPTIGSDGSFSVSASTGTLPANPTGYTITYRYGGDGINFNGAADGIGTLVVNKAAEATLTVTGPSSITYGSTGTATFTGGSGTGAVTFSAAGSTGCSVAGTTVSVSNASGTCTLMATKAADNDYNVTTSAQYTVALAKATPVITWATPAAIAYGTALSATQLNATASVPGTFVYTPALGTVLPAGTQKLSVTFTPTDTADYTTATQTVNISDNEVTVTAGSTSLTVVAGQSGSLQFTLGAMGSLTSPITFACSGLPVGAQCAFSPASVDPASLPVTVTVTITTTPLEILGRNRQSGWPWMLAIFMPGLLLLPAHGSKHKRRQLWIALGMVLLLTIAFVGCGGSPAGQSITNAQRSTPTGTYPVTVTASSAGATQSTITFNLSVTP